MDKLSPLNATADVRKANMANLHDRMANAYAKVGDQRNAAKAREIAANLRSAS